MALWDSPDLLSKCKFYARRPATDQAVTDLQWYSLLSEAQSEVMRELFTLAPDMAYSAPLLLTSSDGGYTYGWGNDGAGDPIRPTGSTEIYPNLSSIPDSPLLPGVDFLYEGAKIRIPNNRSRTWTGGPYSRFVARPDTLLATASNPIMQPKDARILIVFRALEKWASRPGSGAKPSYYSQLYKDRFDEVLLELRTAYNMGSAQAQFAAMNRVWWYGPDFAD